MRKRPCHHLAIAIASFRLSQPAPRGSRGLEAQPKCATDTRQGQPTNALQRWPGASFDTEAWVTPYTKIEALATWASLSQGEGVNMLQKTRPDRETRWGKSIKTQWHNIVAWGKKAELIEKYVKKGQMLAIEGKLINKVLTDLNGKKSKLTQIQVEEVLLIKQQRQQSA